MADVSRVEFAICSEAGDAFEWMDGKAEAISFAAAQPDPCFVQKITEFYPDKEIVWASHSSMIEEADAQ